MIGVEEDLPGDFAEASINDCQNVAQTGQDLEAVVDTNQTVVTRIRLKVVFFHHINTRSGNSKTVAAASFNESAKVRAVALAAGISLNSPTAKRKLSLEASILGHVVVQNLAAQEILFKQCSNRSFLSLETHIICWHSNPTCVKPDVMGIN